MAEESKGEPIPSPLPGDADTTLKRFEDVDLEEALQGWTVPEEYLEETRQGLKKIFGDIDVTKLPWEKLPEGCDDYPLPETAWDKKQREELQDVDLQKALKESAALVPVVEMTPPPPPVKRTGEKPTDLASAKKAMWAALGATPVEEEKEKKDLVDDGFGTVRERRGKDLDDDAPWVIPDWYEGGKDWTPEPPPSTEPPFEPKSVEDLLKGLACPRGLHEKGLGSFEELPPEKGIWLPTALFELTDQISGGSWGGAKTCLTIARSALPILMGEINADHEALRTVVAVGSDAASSLRQHYPSLCVVDVAAEHLDTYTGPCIAVVCATASGSDAALALAFRSHASFVVSFFAGEGAATACAERPVCKDPSLPRSEWLAKQLGPHLQYSDLTDAAKISLPARSVVALDKLCNWGEEDSKYAWVCGKLVATDPNATDIVLVGTQRDEFDTKLRRLG
jgi:hypothetical protein